MRCMPAVAVQLARGILHPHPDERVANPQVVVQEGQRRAHREAVQPQRHLGQFHGQAVLVDTVDAALEHHASDNGLIRQLGFVDDPVGRRGALQDVVADALDALHQRRGVGAVQPRRDRRHVLDQFGDGVRQEIHRGDQEVAAAHRRVENLEVQHRLGRIDSTELGVPFRLGPAVALQRHGLVLERLEPFFCQRLQGAVHDQIDEFLGRVKAAALLANVWIGADGNAPIVVTHRLVLQQAFVDRAKLLHGHVAVVDEAAVAVGTSVTQVVDDGGNHIIRQANRFQQGRGAQRKQAAVIRRQANGGVPLVDQSEQVSQVVVVLGGPRGQGVLVGHALCNVVAHPLAQAVVVVARIIDRQQPAVFGVQNKQQPVQEDQGGLTHG